MINKFYNFSLYLNGDLATSNLELSNGDVT
jgi:hypothetical protein